MLVRDDGDRWTAIGQPAHAWLAAQLARAWSPTPDASVLLAIEQHDAVWSEWDARPTLHRRHRRAASFTEAPAERRRRIWEHAVDRLVAQDPYAALLVSLHASNLHRRYVPEAARSDGYLAQRRREQDALLATLAPLGIDRRLAERDGELLTGLDAISLALCHGAQAAATTVHDGIELRLTAVDVSAGRYELDPWPFATARVHAWLRARTFSERFDDEQALHDAMRDAPWHAMEWVLTPATVA